MCSNQNPLVWALAATQFGNHVIDLCWSGNFVFHLDLHTYWSGLQQPANQSRILHSHLRHRQNAHFRSPTGIVRVQHIV